MCNMDNIHNVNVYAMDGHGQIYRTNLQSRWVQSIRMYNFSQIMLVKVKIIAKNRNVGPKFNLKWPKFGALKIFSHFITVTC